MTELTPRQRVQISLHGGCSDRVPFTIYETMLPQCAAERALRNRGLCIVKRDVPVFKTSWPDVKITQRVFWEDGRKFLRTFYETPVGKVSTLEEPQEATSWHHEKMFKSPEDYKVILLILQNERYAPDYAGFIQAETDFGDDAIFRAGIGLEPLQALISGPYLDMQDWCVQWMDHRDEVLQLYAALVENRRKIYPLVAQSPALHANYGGNVTPEIIGLDTFAQYYLPHYHEAAELLHRHGKLIGCHFDANCKVLAAAIASTELDYIEAFTPAPNSDMTLAEARAAWPGKVLWLNFPSSFHLKSDAEVEALAVDLLNQAGSVDGLIMAVTEDMPPHRWRDSCRAIMDGLERHARENPRVYTAGRRGLCL